MLKQLLRRWPVFITLSLCVAFSLALLMCRLKFTQSFQYLFLVWNIFLAGIPYLLSSYLKIQGGSIQKLTILGGIWLLFLPNAPYIITDFIHLRYAGDSAIWMDIIILFSFAASGLFLYLVSLADMQKIFTTYFGGKISRMIITSVPFLCGFGIYLGRVLRWNSWDILGNPGELLVSIANILLNPGAHSEAWFITFGFGLFLTLALWVFKQLTARIQTLPIKQN